MKNLLCAVGCLILASAVFGSDKKEAELASRYDYVGIVTHARISGWNTTGDKKLSPIDPKKIPKGRVLVGIINDRNDDFFPMKGRIYEEGLLFDKEWDVSMKKETESLWIGWDDGTDIVKISIIRKGAGYRREK